MFLLVELPSKPHEGPQYLGDPDTHIVHSWTCEKLPKNTDGYKPYDDNVWDAFEDNFSPCYICYNYMETDYIAWLNESNYEIQEDYDDLLEKYYALKADYDKLKEDYDFYVEEAEYLDELFTIAAQMQGKDYDELAMECLKYDQ